MESAENMDLRDETKGFISEREDYILGRIAHTKGESIIGATSRECLDAMSEE